jgi:Fatty acid desaturase
LPVILRHWKLEALKGLSAEAEQARERIVRQITRIGKLAGRITERAAEAAAKAAALGTAQGAVAVG